MKKLAGFILALVMATAAYAASVTFQWTNPTLRTDGSALDNLASIRIYCGTTAGGPYTLKADLPPNQNAGAVVDDFAPGPTHYCVARAVDGYGQESDPTTEISRQILPAKPEKPTGFSFRP